MPVYKLCIKIFKKNISTLLIYFFIFLLFSAIMATSASNTQKELEDFSYIKTDIAFINEEESVLVEGLKAELSKVANFIELPDETEALQDALFFGRVKYILRVPEGFTGSFMDRQNVNLEKTIVPASASSAYIDLLVNKYLNTAKIYVQNMEGISQGELVRYLERDLSEEGHVDILAGPENSASSYSSIYFNYMVYPLLSILIYGMSALLISFNNTDIKKRVNCSPLSNTAINIQFSLANLTYAFVVWGLMVAFCLLVDSNNINSSTFYYVLNSFIFTICGTGLAFLIGSLAKGTQAVTALTNVVVLGSCVISGVFVPTELLGSVTLRIGSFTPSYWYVNANNQIARLTQFNFDTLKPVFSDMAVVMLFAAAFFSLAMVIRKERRYS